MTLEYWGYLHPVLLFNVLQQFKSTGRMGWMAHRKWKEINFFPFPVGHQPYPHRAYTVQVKEVVPAQLVSASGMLQQTF